MDDSRRAEILARLTHQGRRVPTPDQLCAFVAEIVGVTGAGVTLMGAGDVQLLAGASDDTSSRLEELQFTLGEGPCLEAHRTGTPVHEPDLAHPDNLRWPAMRAAALEAGAAAIFGYPLLLGDVNLGALNVYNDQPGPLSADQDATAIEMADIAARLLLTVNTGIEDDNPRYQVHQAAGIASAQLDIPVTEALDRLRAHAWANHVSVDTIAADIINHRLRLD